ncbi:dienelactone hydrolase family protein [Pseudonocardia sp. CA-107938]|uniref:dienelactone hydrolase family protein n=1 Tax=Pseudonocardia sp. CA-107938 TaxID=3240021 RepID=UPI003D90BC02
MAHVVLFHSMLGLRAVERRAADLMRAAGHEVVTPDLYAGRTARTLDEGFVLKDEVVGWATIAQRGREAVQDLPPETVLAGISMGCGVVHELLPDRPDTGAVLLLHGVAVIPTTVRAGLPVHLHVADADLLNPPVRVTAWLDATARTPAHPQLFTYPEGGHFFTDPEQPDHHEPTALRTWQRALDLLETA